MLKVASIALRIPIQHVDGCQSGRLFLGGGGGGGGVVPYGFGQYKNGN